VALIVVIGVYPAPVIRYTRYSADQYVSAVDRPPAATAASASARFAVAPGVEP
jgi:NADH:ubiquinone oxidoreductase subunit 4 (subunit M)